MPVLQVLTAMDICLIFLAVIFGVCESLCMSHFFSYCAAETLATHNLGKRRRPKSDVITTVAREQYMPDWFIFRLLCCISWWVWCSWVAWGPFVMDILIKDLVHICLKLMEIRDTPFLAVHFQMSDFCGLVNVL